GWGVMGWGYVDDAVTERATGRARRVGVLENDSDRHSSGSGGNCALAKWPLVMVVDNQRTAIMETAHLVLSAASYAESDGTVINNEGRAHRFFQVYDPAYYDSQTCMLESWRWLHPLHSTLLTRHVGSPALNHAISAGVAKIPERDSSKDAATDRTLSLLGQ
ncbi:molybdopterin-dependent oxidoreductase, partial [Escherichia coli]|nr:molybdopterin-dependent oxidoreductase [Escherichia coli]